MRPELEVQGQFTGAESLAVTLASGASFRPPIGGTGPRPERFPGCVFGDGYAEFAHRCGVMCVPTEMGGTHPVIVEAMAAGHAFVAAG